MAHDKPSTCGFISGLIVGDFKGFPSLQEVECTGKDLKADVDLLSLSMFRTSDSSVLGTLHVIKNSCFTRSDFSSCHIDLENSRKSKLRLLVSDLSEGESREYACKANAINTLGESEISTWNILVSRASEYMVQIVGCSDTLYVVVYVVNLLHHLFYYHHHQDAALSACEPLNTESSAVAYP